MSLDAESYLKTGSNELRVLEYQVSGIIFGINILKVSKIVNDLAKFTRMPDSHPAIAGVFQDMGMVIPVVNLAAILGIEVDRDSEPDKLLVTEFFGMHVGLWVDRVDWIHHFGWEDVIDAEHVFGSLAHKYTIGIVKPSEDRMVQLLDYESILLDLSPQLQIRNESSYQGAADFTGKRILVAEDSPSVRIMLVNELSELGVEVVETADGQTAWDAFQKEPFDLVISDVEMPRMDGLALTLKIRQSDRPKTPVIVYSSIGDVGMKSRARFLEVDAHITKLNLSLLIETADKLMRGEKVDQGIWEDTIQKRKSVETVPLD
ncbi:MAG: chemotaxis protein CheV [candidate division Zixibacteria bacterium]|nr:chemotaxis protein CheV [candidate division Zixibacteria bacterium]